MANVGTLTMSLLANAGGFVSGIRAAQSALSGFASQAQTMSTGIAARLGESLGIGDTIGAAGWGVRLAMEAETAQVAFTVLLKSGTEAKRLLADIKAFADKTPFEFPELRDSARSLLAFGVASSEVVSTMRMLGDIAAGVGIPVGELAALYGKARVSGRLFAEDVNQLTGRGIPVIQAFAAQFGVAESEVRRLVESGQIHFANLDAALRSMTSGSGQFAGMMGEQSKTLSGRFSTLKDSVATLAMTFGTALTPAMSNMMRSFGTMIERLNSLDSATILSVVKWGSYALAIAGTITAMNQLVAVGGKVLASLQSLAKGQAVLTALTGPKGWLQLIATGVAIWGAIDLVNEAFEETHGAVAKAAQASNAFDQQTQANYAEQLKQLKAIGTASDAANPIDAEHERLKKAFDRAAEIVKQFRTPQEVFRDTATELQALFESGMIGAATFQRAMADAANTLREARGDMEAIEAMRRGVGAAVVGTREGFSAVQEASRNARADRALAQMRQRDERPVNREQLLDRQHLAEQKRAADELQRIRQAMGNQPAPQPTFAVANF